MVNFSLGHFLLFIFFIYNQVIYITNKVMISFKINIFKFVYNFMEIIYSNIVQFYILHLHRINRSTKVPFKLDYV
jgi:hypothetical protein